MTCEKIFYRAFSEPHVEAFDKNYQKPFQTVSDNLLLVCGMSEAYTLNQAWERERDFDWLGAVERYKEALGLVSEHDFPKMGEVYERLGYAFYRAAMQAESVGQFRERMRQAVENYEKAKEFYDKVLEYGKTPRMLRCDAMIAYFGYWLSSEVAEKKRLLDECWQRTKEALQAFKEAGNSLEYGKTYNQLSSSAYHLFALEWNFKASPKIIGEAVEYGEQTIILLSDVHDASELARAFAKTTHFLSMYGWYFIPEMAEKDKHYSKGWDYWQKANELSEEAALLELLSVSTYVLAGFLSVDKILMLYQKALDCAEKTKDKYLIGTAMDMLAYANFWKASGIEDPDKRMEIYRKALQYAEDAKHQFSSISYVSPRSCSLWTGAPDAEYHQELALWETDLNKRRDLLEKAVEDGTPAIKQAESTGYPEIIWLANHVVSKALVSLAQMETSPEEKKRLLEKALEHRKETIRISEQFGFFIYWDFGWNSNYLADLKAELSNLEKDSENRKNLLEEAIPDKERGLQLIIKEILYNEKRGVLTYFAALGGYQYSLGELLNRLYGLTNKSEHQRKAIKAFEEAAESFQKLNLVSRMAECYWKAAEGYDILGEHLNAAENFTLASSTYASASEKVPQLKDFYAEHALYMQAWSEIEKAQHYHGKQEYSLAREHFEKAADIHKSLKQWSYLASNYAAWAQVEDAEELSRNEQSEQALQAFERAAKLFNETKKSVQTKLGKVENLDEKQMAKDLLETSLSYRVNYCIARVALEEAKVLDKKGDHYSSSEKYGLAAETLEKTLSGVGPGWFQKEIKYITSLSRAWQKMTQAEAEASPSLYTEASKLFEEAKEHSPNEKAKMLTLGHSHFCRALEAGTKFVDTRDTAIHALTIQHLESAADYYMKAGFQSASEYAKATGLLFDARLYTDNAKRETDPERKAKLYMMAEKVLQSSANSYMKAEHQEKREQVLRLLEKVREERDLAISLAEVLHIPPIHSTTAFANPISLTSEKAVGLEKFEHAEIQANMMTRQKELKVGDDLDLEIELVNAGKGPALVTRITEVSPEGFEIIEKPETCRVEDGCVNMKGKRLDPLKIEEVRFVLKPTVKGVFPLKPTILYLDENGKYKSHKPEPITITVKELGIKGWIKGER